MWIVSYDTGYYPYIEKFRTYEEAKKRYEELREDIVDDDLESYNDDCVFLSKVERYTVGEDYVLKYKED